MQKAKRGDWKIQPMPAESKSLATEGFFTWEEFDNLSDGFIPQSMDDRWFMFYEEPILHLHRGWTGYCIFSVRFEPLSDGMQIAEVTINRDQNQYALTDDEGDLNLLKMLLSNRAKLNIRPLVAERIAKHQQAIVAAAEKMLSGEVGVVEGAQKLAALGTRRKWMTSESSEDQFQLLSDIYSNADVLPPETSRQYWNQEILKIKEEKFAAYETSVKDAALQACRDLINAYKIQMRSDS